MKYCLILIIFFSILSCGKDDEDMVTHSQIIRTQNIDNLKLVLKDSKELEVEVMYEPGAEPYTDTSFRQMPYWSFFEANIRGIYESRSMNVSLSVPKLLSEMKMTKIHNKESWSAADILKTIDEFSEKKSSATKTVIKVLFVKGNFRGEDGSINSNVIGVNVTGTFHMAIFKDVVERMGITIDDKYAKFAEQSTLVHEFGHAAGLVNNGVPQVEAHHDSEHGAHCTNPDCVMYWKNEGATEMVNFIRNYFDSGSEMMFKEKCLDDLKKY